mgnify:CR=1 FL=1
MKLGNEISGNLVELLVDEQRGAPCKHGNIVEGHACYCHHPDSVRKCPIWRRYSENLEHWHANGDWNEDGWSGGCVFFEPRQDFPKRNNAAEGGGDAK